VIGVGHSRNVAPVALRATVLDRQSDVSRRGHPLARRDGFRPGGFGFGSLIWAHFFFSALPRNCALILFLLRVFTIATRVRTGGFVAKLKTAKAVTA
jgi:hypothetical protein